jgi:hypothetical protein
MLTVRSDMGGADRSTGRDRDFDGDDERPPGVPVARLTERQLWQLAAGLEVTVAGEAVSSGERIRIEAPGFDAASAGPETRS